MEYIHIGKITSTHGLKGELKLKSSFLYKEKVLKKDFCFYIGENKEQVILSSSRYHNGFDLLTFKNYNDINDVENFRNKEVYVKREDLNLKENEYLHEDYIGLNVYFDNKKIGTITDVIDCGNQNYVLIVTGEKEILIPLNDKFIKQIVLNDKIQLKEVEGLINAN